MAHFIATPRFSETDALGHINNAVVSVWFEEARKDLFRLFNPDLSIAKWNLILRKVEVEFLAQIQFGSDVTVETVVKHVGTTSFGAGQRALQNGHEVARGSSILLYFDYESQTKAPIPDDIRSELEKRKV